MTKVLRSNWREIMNIATILITLLALLGKPFNWGRKYEKMCVEIQNHTDKLKEVDNLFSVNASEHFDIRCEHRKVRDYIIRKHGEIPK